jgi:hypothetical protein
MLLLLPCQASLGCSIACLCNVLELWLEMVTLQPQLEYKYLNSCAETRSSFSPCNSKNTNPKSRFTMLTQLLIVYAFGLASVVNALPNLNYAANTIECGTILGLPCPDGYTCVYPKHCADCEGTCTRLQK